MYLRFPQFCHQFILVLFKVPVFFQLRQIVCINFDFKEVQLVNLIFIVLRIVRKFFKR